MSGISVTVPGSTSSGGLQLGFFLKMSFTAPNSNIMLVQLGLPCAGWLNIILNTSSQIACGFQATGGGGNWSGSQTSTSGISVANWYYITYALGYVNPNVVQHMYIYQNGIGWYDGTATSVSTAVATDTNLPAVLGVGTIVNSPNALAGYQSFPQIAGCEISKLWVRNANPSGATAWGGPTGATALTVPVSDSAITALSPLVFYNCQQTVGAASTLTDATSNHFDGTAGPTGLAIVADGPYA